MSLPSDCPHGIQPTRARSAGVAGAAARGLADWLGLAAAPTFAIMALLTAASNGGDMPGMAAPDASPLSGMTLMYLLMSAFHLTPWLKLIACRTFGKW